MADEGVTIGYNVLEGVVAVSAGLVAGSVALTERSILRQAGLLTGGDQ